ncbi:MAG: adenine nucleotide alpha hydrolase [Myxococcales bacterium]|nr:adenine nucleotide alpha hydrolase [Myxococcales bacterium]
MADEIWLCWSSGKDSAWTLRALQDDPRVRVTTLVTTMNAAFDRVAMHSVRRTLVEQQAAAAGLELELVEIPWPCTNAQYEAAMAALVTRARDAGVTKMAFGDLFLADVRQYREKMLADTGIEARFPIWGRDTRELADEMVANGLEAVVTCIDPKVLGSEWAGRRFDAEFLAALPAGIDPCGERGEFHTFTYAGPMFEAPIPIETGEVVERDGFVFADVLPAQGAGITDMPLEEEPACSSQ